MLSVEELRNMSSLGRLRYLLEQEFEKPKVDKMIKAAAHYSKDDVERVTDAVYRFGAEALLSAAEQIPNC